MSPYMKRAHELRAITEPHYNCAQSVTVSFAPVMGITEQQAYAMAANFGGGMKMGSVCGALTGCLMVLGYCGLDDVGMLQNLYRGMRKRHENAMNCVDLLRLNSEKGLPKKPHCDAMVYEFIEVTENLLREHGVLPA